MQVTDELLATSEQVKEEKKVPIEVVPDLCGMKEVRDSIVQGIKVIILYYISSIPSLPIYQLILLH